MVTELASLLPQPKRQGCETALHQRIFSDYTEAAPYSTADRSQIEQCLEAMQAASSLDDSADVLTKQERQEIISATLRWVNRDFTSDGESTSNRDRSMFQTFQWLQDRLPEKHKIIIWAATVHVAKQGDPTWGDHAGTNFGSFIHAEYGNRARSLGFSAEGGTFRQGKGNFPELPRAPADSVEALALQRTAVSAIHLGTKQLAAMALRPGAFFYHSYQTLAWSSYLDDVVVFRTEHPPADTR